MMQHREAESHKSYFNLYYITGL